MVVFQKLRNGIFRFFRGVKSGMADIFLFSGLCLFGYGLFLYERWISFAVCGALLMVYGLMIGLRDGQT